GGAHSPWIAWEDITARDPDVIIVAPCGFDLARTRGEMHWLTGRQDFPRLKAVRTGRLFLADGNQFFNRPGSRIVETLEILKQAIAADPNRELPIDCGSAAWAVYSKGSTLA